MGATGTERGGLEFTKRINVKGSAKLDVDHIKTSTAAQVHTGLCVCFVDCSLGYNGPQN